MSLSIICASHDGKCFYPGFAVQLCGIILKRLPKSSKWKKKVCVIRDGFFLVFRDDAFSQNSRLNYIPISALEGLVPLGKARVVADGDNENPYCFRVSSSEIQEDLVFSVGHAEGLKRWMNAFTSAQVITFEKLSDLEKYSSYQEENVKVSQENVRYKELFRTLSAKNEELLQLNQYLDGEREELAHCVENLQRELENIRQELQLTQVNMQTLEVEKHDLHRKNSVLEVELQNLNKEKDEYGTVIDDASSDGTEMAKRLEDISIISERLQREKLEISEELQKKEAVFSTLEKERNKFERQASELSDLLKSLEEQKQEIQERLNDETLARREAEQRLKEAEAALARLQENICNKGTNYTSDEKQEMSVDVSKLKSFFEVRSSTTQNTSTFPPKLSKEPRLLVANREASFRQKKLNSGSSTNGKRNGSESISGDEDH